ncbi:MAG: hypothetical protein ACXV3A_03235 [Kineosporiaceae bacterium]
MRRRARGGLRRPRVVLALVSWLEQWDAQFYLAIARSGYSVAGPLGQDLYAFFPGYPLPSGESPT